MSKRYYSFVLILLIGFILIGCRFGAEKNNSEELELNREFEVVEEKYQIVSKKYVEDNVEIEYPQVESLSDTDVKDKVNTILKEDAMRVLEIYGDTQDLHLSLSYDIAHEGEKLLSVAFTGTGYVEGAAYPNNHFASSNINLTNGDRVVLEDAFIVDEAFIEKFFDGTFIAVIPEHNNELVTEVVTENLSTKLKEADHRKDKTEIECYSYYMEDYLVLIFSVPHALGDYVQYQALYINLKDNINYKNPIWENSSLLKESLITWD